MCKQQLQHQKVLTIDRVWTRLRQKVPMAWNLGRYSPISSPLIKAKSLFLFNVPPAPYWNFVVAKSKLRALKNLWWPPGVCKIVEAYVEMWCGEINKRLNLLYLECTSAVSHVTCRWPPVLIEAKTAGRHLLVVFVLLLSFPYTPPLTISGAFHLSLEYAWYETILR